MSVRPFPSALTPRDGKPFAAIDADGVLLDYHEAYGRAWAQAFGEHPKARNPNAYHAPDFWDVPRLDKAGQQRLHESGFTEALWESMRPLDGALEACQELARAGYRLICLTALPTVMGPARERNLRALGFEFEGVIATGHTEGVSPKRAALHQMRPEIFVDDCLPYLQGAPESTWLALIDAGREGSQNHDAALEQPHSRHTDLLAFTRWWLSEGRRGAKLSA